MAKDEEGGRRETPASDHDTQDASVSQAGELEYSSHGQGGKNESRKEYARKQRQAAYQRSKEYKKKVEAERKRLPKTQRQIDFDEQRKARAKEIRRDSYLRAKQHAQKIAKKTSEEDSHGRNSFSPESDSSNLLTDDIKCEKQSILPFGEKVPHPAHKLSARDLVKKIGNKHLHIIAPTDPVVTEQHAEEIPTKPREHQRTSLRIVPNAP